MHCSERACALKQIEHIRAHATMFEFTTISISENMFRNSRAHSGRDFHGNRKYDTEFVPCVVRLFFIWSSVCEPASSSSSTYVWMFCRNGNFDLAYKCSAYGAGRVSTHVRCVSVRTLTRALGRQMCLFTPPCSRLMSAHSRSHLASPYISMCMGIPI